MKIMGTEGMTVEQLNAELMTGGKFVIFEYCISLVVITFRRGSGIYFIGKDEGYFKKCLPYCLISLVLGWWGIPWGPIFTIASLITNLRGGKDISNEIIASLNQAQAQPQAQA